MSRREGPGIGSNMTEPDEERLEQVGEQIREARKHAADADLITDEDEPKFYESGEKSRDDDGSSDAADRSDDQTIAPPG